MRTGISITITRSVRGRLEAITRDRNASQKHAYGSLPGLTVGAGPLRRP